MSPSSQTMLARFAVATSVFALLMVGIVAATKDSGGGSGEVATGPVAVALTEFQISPATITVPKGGSIAVSNNGTMVHNVAVTDTAIRSADLAAGASETVDLSSLAPGEYEIFCAIPGHKDSGMVAKLVITDGSAAAAGGETVVDPAAGTHDISTLEASDPKAKAINQRFMDDMDAGVKQFLDFAAKYGDGSLKTGNQKLEPKILADGTKRFELTAAITDWEVSPGKVVKAWTYNGMVPGPWIKVDPGDKVEVVLHNEMPMSTDIHWHGIDGDQSIDGVAGLTQDYIKPNTSYTYKFTAKDHPQLAMYHAHFHGQQSVVNGLFAMAQVGDVPLPRGETISGVEVPADLKVTQEIPMVLNDAGVIGLSLNGKAFPETQPIVAKKGEWLLLHYYNEGLLGHPMHLHRQPHLVVAKDGFALSAPYRIDTLWISPGERYSVLIQAEEVGTWAFHCHILSHAESDAGLMGMVTAMIVQE